jgi:hypothetical protein
MLQSVQYTSPVTGAQVPFVSIKVGLQYTCGIVPLTFNETVACWNGTAAWLPPVSGDFVELSDGCALDRNGTMLCW